MMRCDGQRDFLTRRPGGTLTRPSGLGGIANWDPWQEMAEMRRRMDDLFGSFFGAPLANFGDWGQIGRMSGMEPDVDVYDNQNEYIVHAALPGCRPEDINLQATDD